VEGALQVEDRLAVLDRNDAARRERLAVTNPVDLVEDRIVWVARAQEVGVERVDESLLDGAPGRNERLRRDLAAEDAQSGPFEVPTSEDVHLDGLEVEESEEFGDASSHGRDGTLRAMATTGQPSRCAPENEQNHQISPGWSVT